jgi:hypothetical protein
MEHEFVQNQEQLKPQDERHEEDRSKVWLCTCGCWCVLLAGRVGWCVGWLVSGGWRVLEQGRMKQCVCVYGKARQVHGIPRTAVARCTAHAALPPQVDDLRGSPLSVGTLEEIIDEK